MSPWGLGPEALTDQDPPGGPAEGQAGSWGGAHAPSTSPSPGSSHHTGELQTQLCDTCQAQKLGPTSPQWYSCPLAHLGCAEEAGQAQLQPPSRCREKLPSSSGWPPIFYLLRAPINLNLPLAPGVFDTWEFKIFLSHILENTLNCIL